MSETFNAGAIECPYCQAVMTNSLYEYFRDLEENGVLIDCDTCEKEFVVSRSVTFYYRAKAKNEKPHIEEMDRMYARIQALEAERDRLLQKTQQLEAERERLREALRTTAKHVGGATTPDVSSQFLCQVPEEVNLKDQALKAERDRYKAALEYIESTPTTWTLGVDENMERLRTIATQALKGGGDE